jgi:hypothetical protein
MITRETLLDHLRGLEGIRLTGEDIFLLTVAWDGMDRVQDVTIEVGSDNVALYSAIAHADDFESERVNPLLTGMTIPSEFNLTLYEFYPPDFHWCLSHVSRLSQFESIDQFRSTTILLANIADIVESKISNHDSL